MKRRAFEVTIRLDARGDESEESLRDVVKDVLDGAIIGDWLRVGAVTVRQVAAGAAPPELLRSAIEALTTCARCECALHLPLSAPHCADGCHADDDETIAAREEQYRAAIAAVDGGELELPAPARRRA